MNMIQTNQQIQFKPTPEISKVVGDSTNCELFPEMPPSYDNFILLDITKNVIHRKKTLDEYYDFVLARMYNVPLGKLKKTFDSLKRRKYLKLDDFVNELCTVVNFLPRPNVKIQIYTNTTQKRIGQIEIASDSPYQVAAYAEVLGLPRSVLNKAVNSL